MYSKLLRFVILLMISWSSAAADLVFVVNINNKSEFSQAQLMQLYLRKAESFSDGVAANLYHLPRNSAEHQQFCMGILNLTANQYQSFWSRLLFTGNVSAMAHRDNSQMLLQIQTDKAGIGYLPLSADHAGVRAVAILRDRQLEILVP